MEEYIIKDLPLDQADVVILQAPFEATVSGGAGTSKGPKAIIEMLSTQVEDYEPNTKKIVYEDVNIITQELELQNLKSEDMIKTVQHETQKILENEKFPVIIGGEHSVTIGAVQAVKKHYPELTVLQIDAHADLRDDDSDYNETPNKYAHCCVMRRIRDLGCETVQVGLRTFFSGEINYIEENNLQESIFEAPVKGDEIGKIINAIKTDDIYITIDIDGIDPSFMPGTGTPVQGGLDWYFTFKLLRELFKNKNIVGFDIVEVSPQPHTNLTEYGAAQLTYSMIGFKFEEGS